MADQGLTEERLDAIRARCAAATGAEWLADEDGYVFLAESGEPVARCESPADADLIAHAPDDLRLLLNEVERDEARAQVERVRALHHPIPPAPDWRKPSRVCRGCSYDWPCPTVAALDDPQDAQNAAQEAADAPTGTPEGRTHWSTDGGAR